MIFEILLVVQKSVGHEHLSVGQTRSMLSDEGSEWQIGLIDHWRRYERQILVQDHLGGCGVCTLSSCAAITLIRSGTTLPLSLNCQVQVPF